MFCFATTCWPPAALLLPLRNSFAHSAGDVDGAAFAIELSFLHGREKLPGMDVFSLIQYDK